MPPSKFPLPDFDSFVPSSGSNYYYTTGKEDINLWKIISEVYGNGHFEDALPVIKESIKADAESIYQLLNHFKEKIKSYLSFPKNKVFCPGLLFNTKTNKLVGVIVYIVSVLFKELRTIGSFFGKD